jgi:hypothetical protein
VEELWGWLSVRSDLDRTEASCEDGGRRLAGRGKNKTLYIATTTRWSSALLDQSNAFDAKPFPNCKIGKQIVLFERIRVTREVSEK